jgi:hypothetical protein
MGRLGHSKVSSTWGIFSPSYVELAKSHAIAVKTLFMEG